MSAPRKQDSDDNSNDEGLNEAAATDPHGFEQRLEQLESYLEELERGDLPLEEAIRKYESAVAELRQCYKLVSAAEAKVEELLEDSEGKPRVTPLDEGSAAGAVADEERGKSEQRGRR